MTYILQKDISPIANPDIVTEPNRAELEVKLGAYNKERGLNDHGHPTWFLQRGMKLPDLPVPEAAMAARTGEKPMKRFPDMLNMGIYTAISERMRRVIEEIEPDVHQFVQVIVYSSRIKSDPRPYYVWIVGRAIDLAIDFERTLVPISESYGRRYVSVPHRVNSTKIVLRKAEIDHAHIWRAMEIARLIMISDVVFKEFSKMKLWGFKCMLVTTV